jgi:hypothetical protein
MYPAVPSGRFAYDATGGAGGGPQHQQQRGNLAAGSPQPSSSSGAAHAAAVAAAAAAHAAAVNSGEPPLSIRVKIADEFRLDPAVTVPAAMDAVAPRGAAADTADDFEYERRVLAEAEAAAAGNGASSAGDDPALEAALARPEESYYRETRAARFLSMGFSVSAVSLAISYAQMLQQRHPVVRPSPGSAVAMAPGGAEAVAVAEAAAARDPDAVVVDFCNNYTQLLGMGFRPAVAAGALVRVGNDLSAATDACLAATEGG